MERFLLLLLLLWDAGVEGAHEASESVRLAGGASRCAGTVEAKREGEWRVVEASRWSLETAGAFCRRLDCGSLVSVRHRKGSSLRPVLEVTPGCVQSASALQDCATSRYSFHHTELTCSDSVRLLNGSSLCSGSVQVLSDQSNQHWAPMCEADFDLNDAEVVCRELGCGHPMLLQGGLHGDVQTSEWSPEFHCRGNESALLDCGRSSSARSSCSPDLRLVGGASRCAGIVELKHLEEWRPAGVFHWTLPLAAAFCKHLDCGSPLRVEQVDKLVETPVWWVSSDCVRSASSPSLCALPESFSHVLELSCSDSIRLVNGSSLCSGSVQVLSNQSNQHWAPMCEADFDLNDAEVVCRELGCGHPMLLQGGLHGDVQTSEWSPEFHCGGNESALLDCRRSRSARSSCSPGKVVGLTCSEPLMLVGGASRCAGTVQVRHAGEWRPAYVSGWNLQVAAAFCERLRCGAAVSVDRIYEVAAKSGWQVRTDRLQAGADLREIVTSRQTSANLTLICSGLQ